VCSLFISVNIIPAVTDRLPFRPRRFVRVVLIKAVRRLPTKQVAVLICLMCAVTLMVILIAALDRI
jgi:hypothetical protein